MDRCMLDHHDGGSRAAHEPFRRLRSSVHSSLGRGRRLTISREQWLHVQAYKHERPKRSMLSSTTQTSQHANNHRHPNFPIACIRAHIESACISAIERAASSPRSVPALVRFISINDICVPIFPPSLVNIIPAITPWSQCTADLSSLAS